MCCVRFRSSVDVREGANICYRCVLMAVSFYLSVDGRPGADICCPPLPHYANSLLGISDSDAFR